WTEQVRIEVQRPRLLPFLPQAVRHVKKPNILHCLCSARASKTEVRDGTWLRQMQLHRFLHERVDPLHHLLQAKGGSHTPTTSLSHFLSALRIAEKLH